MDKKFGTDRELAQLRARVVQRAEAPAVGRTATPEGDATNRRAFSLAALSVTAAEILRRISSDTAAATLSDLESDVEDFAAAYDHTPHGVLLPQVAARWQTVQTRLDRGRISVEDLPRAELLAGQFSYFLGRISFAEGRYRESRRFADLAERHAFQADDALLVGSVAALRSSIALYTRRYTAAASIAGRARSAAPSYLASRLAAYEARSWAACGRPGEAAEALREMRDAVIQASPLPGSSPFDDGSADMFTAVCFVQLDAGRDAEHYAVSAVERLAGGSYEERGHALLALANARLLRDRPDLAAAADAASRAIDIPDGHRTSTLQAAAGRVWRRMQPWAEDGDVGRFGELVASRPVALPAGDEG
jgi:hypothetical protein